MVSPCAGVARQHHLLDSGVGRDTQEERDSSGNNGCGIADHRELQKLLMNGDAYLLYLFVEHWDLGSGISG